jgi:hypothetical protein
VYLSSFKINFSLSNCKKKIEFLSRFSKYLETTNFIKSPPPVAQLLHADGQKYRHDEANSGFSQLCEKQLTIPTTLQLFRFCVAEIRLCVLQTAVGSLE